MVDRSLVRPRLVFLPTTVVAQVDSRTQLDFLRLCKSKKAIPEAIPGAIQEYLDQGLDPNAPDPIGPPIGSLALAMCAKRNDIESCRILIEAGADVNFVKECCDDGTALHVAMMNFRDPVGVVEVLLAAGANLDALTTKGETPLHPRDSRDRS